LQFFAKNVPAFAELVDKTALKEAVLFHNHNKSWDWNSVDRIWPYLHIKWMLDRLRIENRQSSAVI
jgi:asparagine synthase (glutamine-hydrolysing)